VSSWPIIDAVRNGTLSPADGARMLAKHAAIERDLRRFARRQRWKRIAVDWLMLGPARRLLRG
jgi:hypothetical protein